MSSMRPISIRIYGSRYASYVPLDLREIRKILEGMADYLLNSERGFTDILGIHGRQDILPLQASAAEKELQSSHRAVSREGCPSLNCSTNADSVLLAVKAFPSVFSGDLSLTFVRDSAMYVANKQHMGCASPTNILSFPLFTSSNEGILVPPVGDMLLSVDTVRREAFIYGQESNEYAISLLAHGMAHMAGLDHGEAMTFLEQALLAYSLSRV